MKKQFYIYVQCRPSGEPFNVGKGQGKRAYDFKRNRNQHFKNIVKKHGDKNILVYTRNCMSEKQAHQHEIWMIAYGRIQGWRLSNQTDGGEGVSGLHHTPEACIKMSIARKGKPLSAVTCAKMSVLRKGSVPWNKGKRGKPRSVETRAKLSIASTLAWADPLKLKGSIPWNKGKSLSAECCAKLSASHMGQVPRNKGSMWITDGVCRKMIKGKVPSGWVRGMSA